MLNGSSAHPVFLSVNPLKIINIKHRYLGMMLSVDDYKGKKTMANHPLELWFMIDIYGLW